MKYILGVDGGATKSHLAVFSETGKCVHTVSYGPLNHEEMENSFDDLERHLNGLIGSTLDKLNATPGDIAYAVFGLAGMDTSGQAKIVTGMINDTGLSGVLVCNDAVLGVPAGCPEGMGICAINGTGFKLAAIDKNGYIQDTCGLGPYTDDKGGSTWYCERICGEVYNALFRFGKPTKMRDMLFELLGVSQKSTLLDTIIENLYYRYDVIDSIKLCSIVFDAAAMGDEAALGILDESAIQYGGAIARLACDMYFPCDETVYVTLAGSVFVKQKVRILHDMIARHVTDYLGDRKVEYSCLEAPPVSGAVILAAQTAGFDINPADVRYVLISKLC